MALSPSIPTSFVPKSTTPPGRPKPRGGWNVFALASFLILLFALLASGGVFAYQRYLEGVTAAKAAELEAAKKTISASTAEAFIRTRDRFTSAQTILDEHIVFSKFLTLLESKALENVRFSVLDFDVTSEGTFSVEMIGVARTFNALAAQSRAFNEERNIKRAIFSDIAVNDNDTVSFSFSAELDPRLIRTSLEDVPPQEAPDVAPVIEDVGTDTASTSAPQVPSPAPAPVSGTSSPSQTP